MAEGARVTLSTSTRAHIIRAACLGDMGDIWMEGCLYSTLAPMPRANPKYATNVVCHHSQEATVSQRGYG
jgi:hypothetical protein